MSERVTNIFSGQVVNILNSIIVTEITVYVSDSIKIVAIITSESYESLAVTAGTMISAVVKPTEILVGKGENGSRFSTRNCLVGVVEELKPCDSMVEVIGSLDGGICISALATIESIDEINLQVGDNVSFFFKAFSVILAII